MAGGVSKPHEARGTSGPSTLGGPAGNGNGNDRFCVSDRGGSPAGEVASIGATANDVCGGGVGDVDEVAGDVGDGGSKTVGPAV